MRPAQGQAGPPAGPAAAAGAGGTAGADGAVGPQQHGTAGPQQQGQEMGGEVSVPGAAAAAGAGGEGEASGGDGGPRAAGGPGSEAAHAAAAAPAPGTNGPAIVVQREVQDLTSRSGIEAYWANLRALYTTLNFNNEVKQACFPISRVANLITPRAWDDTKLVPVVDFLTLRVSHSLDGWMDDRMNN